MSKNRGRKVMGCKKRGPKIRSSYHGTVECTVGLVKMKYGFKTDSVPFEEVMVRVEVL